MCKAQCEFLIVETPPPSKQTFKTFEQYRQLLYSVKKQSYIECYNVCI